MFVSTSFDVTLEMCLSKHAEHMHGKKTALRTASKNYIDIEPPIDWQPHHSIAIKYINRLRWLTATSGLYTWLLIFLERFRYGTGPQLAQDHQRRSQLICTAYCLQAVAKSTHFQGQLPQVWNMPRWWCALPPNSLKGCNFLGIQCLSKNDWQSQYSKAIDWTK